MGDARPTVAAKASKSPGRLAFRIEGDNWNAYWALPDTMEGAALLGSIRLDLCAASEKVKQSFFVLMREATSVLIREAFGVRPDWGKPINAPPHERAGHA